MTFSSKVTTLLCIDACCLCAVAGLPHELLLFLATSGLGHALFMSVVLTGLGPYGSFTEGETGEGSKALDAARSGLTISIARVRGEASAARRNRRPTNRRAVPMMKTERKYAPTMEPICAGR